MNAVMKQQIITELDSLPDKKVDSLLDYLHFLKQESIQHNPNEETRRAIKQADRERESLKGYSSAKEMFQDLGMYD